MNDNAEKRLAAYETGYMCGPAFVALDDVLIWARAVAELPRQPLADRSGDDGDAAGHEQHDMHVAARQERLAALRRAAE
ncbi:hypothetical protein BRADO6382 [Bradyrhizobium sp. ORS 278]|uniref:hypothetical protein n=1 Tax=Bradyrhizobium sp. (strain ORS 278) TaxID=114615 RepID=UPI00015083E6|nr:hypothetical protein [Bradyrhizobium sp. ORS 278]CAL80014.1 hypothetical protein BRADO6382 [Bradyrhizobium sp. ORS 278]